MYFYFNRVENPGEGVPGGFFSKSLGGSRLSGKISGFIGSILEFA
jgi:hypothetical protein